MGSSTRKAVVRLCRTLQTQYGTTLLYTLFCMSIALNVYLGHTLRQKGVVRRAGVQVGQRLVQLEVVSSTGAKEQIRLNDGRRSVLYIMSPRCAWCKKNERNIRHLANNSGTGTRFVGLSTIPLPAGTQAAHQLPMPFPVYVVAGKPTTPDMSVTPQLILLGPDGIVQKSWIGALDEKQQAEVEKVFNVKLPGLS